MAGADSPYFGSWGESFPCSPSALPAIPSSSLSAWACAAQPPSQDVTGLRGRFRRQACEYSGPAGLCLGSRFLGSSKVCPHPHQPSWKRLVLEVASGTCPRVLRVGRSTMQWAARALPSQPPQPRLSAWLRALGKRGSCHCGRHIFHAKEGWGELLLAWTGSHGQQASPCPLSQRPPG